MAILLQLLSVSLCRQRSSWSFWSSFCISNDHLGFQSFPIILFEIILCSLTQGQNGWHIAPRPGKDGDDGDGDGGGGDGDESDGDDGGDERGPYQ